VGIAETIYPQRPGQIECDVSKDLYYVLVIIFPRPMCIWNFLHVSIYLLGHLVLNLKNAGGQGFQFRSIWLLKN